MHSFAIVIFASVFVRLAYAQVFNPVGYGAKGDGISKDTHAIRTMLAAVSTNNGGEVLFDDRFAYLTGCFNITSNVILNVRGTLLASQDSNDYVQVRGAKQWQSVIQSIGTSNVTITGGGTIDGQGAPWWYCFHRGNDSLHLHGPPCNGLDRPNLLMLALITDLTIFDITLKDSPSLTTHMHGCTNVHIHHVTILAPGDSPNTDGFDIDCSFNVLLENSFYSGGDDAIAVACGAYHENSSENVLIRNMTVERSHGLSIGSGTGGGVRNITFDHITVNGSDNGIRIKTQRGNGGFVRDVTHSNIQIYNVKTAITITSNYHQNLPPANVSATPQIANINLKNIYSSGAHYGWFFDGLPESYIGNVSLADVELVQTSQLTFSCGHAYGSCANVRPSCPPCF